MSTQTLAGRARILLLLADGVTPKAVSDQLQVTPPTVFKWRKRYLEAGIEGLKDFPRSGHPLKLGPEKINEIITLMTQRPQGGHSLERSLDGQVCAVHHVAGSPGLGRFRPQTPSTEDFQNQQADHIDVWFDVPSGSLVLDAVLCVTEIKQGFDIRENDVIAEMITSVSVIDIDVVRIAIFLPATLAAVLSNVRPYTGR